MSIQVIKMCKNCGGKHSKPERQEDCDRELKLGRSFPLVSPTLDEFKDILLGIARWANKTKGPFQ